MKKKLKIFLLLTSWILLSVTGCFSQTDSITPSQITSEPAEEDGNIIPGDNPEVTTLIQTENPTSSPTHIPTIEVAPPVVQSTSDNELEVGVENDLFSATVTSTRANDLDGNIYIRSLAGISRFSMVTEEMEDLVSIDPDGDSLGFDLSPDRKQLAYWLHEGDRSELWITELAQWSPELVFSISGIGHEWVGLWWLNDQYLLFEPGNFDQRNNFFIPAKSYLINVPQQSVEIETGSLIWGCSLAVSPQSNQVATWCPAIEGWSDPQSYFTTPPSNYVVIEDNGTYWLSDLAPADVLVEYRGLPEDIWSWSYQGEYVAFSTYDESAKERTLEYIDAPGSSLITVEDESTSYHTLDWSPDQKYISFVGDCSGKGCNKIVDFDTQKVVWTSAGLPGAENGTYLNWSYDSNYIIVQSEGITIIDIKTGENIRNFKKISGGVIVWTP